KKSRKSLSVGIVEPLRHEESERSADDVTRGIAENPLRPWVEVGDVSTFVCGHDGIGRCLSHGAEPFFALLQRLLRPLAGVKLRSQLVVDVLYLLRPAKHFRFHFSRARSQSLADLDLLRFPENVRFHFSRACSHALANLVLIAAPLLPPGELLDVLAAV